MLSIRNLFLTLEVRSFDPRRPSPHWQSFNMRIEILMFFDSWKRVPLTQGSDSLDYHRTVNRHANRDFNISYKKCSFEAADIQGNKHFIRERLFSTRKIIGYPSNNVRKWGAQLRLFSLLFLLLEPPSFLHKTDNASDSRWTSVCCTIDGLIKIW